MRYVNRHGWTARFFFLGLAGATLVAASGCSDDETSASSTSTQAPAAESARLRVVHASPTAPAVDVYIKGQTTPLVSELAYGSATTYLAVPPGTYEVELRAAGSPAADAPAYTTPALELGDGDKVSAVAAGDLASSDPADAFRVLAITEDDWIPTPGMSRARIIHASFDAPTVDLDVGNDDPMAPEIPGVARFADTGPVEIPSGASYQIGIAAGGSRVTAFTTPVLTEGADGLIIATGQLGRLPREDAGFSLLAVEADGSSGWIRQNPVVYAVHASSDAPPVDIYAGDAELVDNASFGGAAAVQVPPGSYTLDFFAG